MYEIDLKVKGMMCGGCENRVKLDEIKKGDIVVCGAGEKIADIVSGYFVPSVIIIAFLAFAFNLIIGTSFLQSLTTFVTILVVACPCSLGLATPLAIIVSEGLCATNGILVKKSEILENAKKVNTIVFDKTGTLTYGKLKISKIINYSDIDDKKLLQLVASIGMVLSSITVILNTLRLRNAFKGNSN